jgi:hypothetical protein
LIPTDAREGDPGVEVDEGAASSRPLYGSLRELCTRSTVRHAAVCTLFEVAEEPYNGLAARSAAKNRA